MHSFEDKPTPGFDSQKKHRRENKFRLVIAESCLMVAVLATIGGCSVQTKENSRSVEGSQSGTGVSLDRPNEHSKSSIRFREVAAEVGLSITFPQQPRPMRTLESFGCGCASFDFDNDGWQDVLVVSDPRPMLFRNMQNGRFSDVGAATGMNTLPEGNWTGCAIGDFSGDGWLDFALTGYHCICLCRNDRGVGFQNVTKEAGLSTDNDHRWGAGAGFMDLDGDQWLDLVVLNYVHFDQNSQQYCDNGKGLQTSCPPKVYEPEFGVIYRNEAGTRFDAVPFENAMRDTHGIGLVIAFSDINSDGLSDLYIGNDARNADLLINDGQMRFRNEGLASGLAMSRKTEPPAAMGADWCDFNRDGRLDLAVSDFQDKGALLYQNLGDTVFADVSEKTGLAQETDQYLGFGLNWMDFDNDGWPDLALLHGHVYENIADWRPEVSYRQPIVLMHNNGSSFQRVSVPEGDPLSRPIVGRGSASLDFDNDGDLDLLAVDYEGRLMLLENETTAANHWLTLDLRGRSPNAFGYGARVSVQSGNERWVGQVSPSSSYLSSEDPRISFGLGSVSLIDRIDVTWSSGVVQTLRMVKADQILVVIEP